MVDFYLHACFNRFLPHDCVWFLAYILVLPQHDVGLSNKLSYHNSKVLENY